MMKREQLRNFGDFWKNITLKRFKSEETYEYESLLFQKLQQMPVRNEGKKEGINIGELYMHLKRFNCLYPTTIGKEAFMAILNNLVGLGSRYMVD